MSKAENTETIKVGIVRPISAIPNDDMHTFEHWANVESVVKSALDETMRVNPILKTHQEETNNKQFKFEVKLVSEEKASDMIQSTIVQNLYDSDVVICDVSLNNPNVFFELGIRMGFKKPCIIIQEEGLDRTPFDIKPIRYLPYPKHLAFNQTIKFQKELRNYVLAAHTLFSQNEEVSYDSFFVKINRVEMKEINQSSTEIVESKLSSLELQLNELSGLLRHQGIRLKLTEEQFLEYAKEKLESFVSFAKSKNFHRDEFIQKARDYILYHSERDGYSRLSKFAFDRTYNQILQEIHSKSIFFQPDEDDIPF